MSLVKVESNCFVNVVDSLTQLALDCDIRVVVGTEVNIVDEAAYRATVKGGSIDTILKEYMGNAMSMAIRRAYPGGIEYSGLKEKLNEITMPIAGAIKELLGGIMGSYGVELTDIIITELEISKPCEKMFEDMRAKKQGLQQIAGMNTVNNNTEWVCKCGAKNISKFCPECGTPKPLG